MRTLTDLNQIFPLWDTLKQYIDETIDNALRDNAPSLGILKEVDPASLRCLCTSPFNTGEIIPAILALDPNLSAFPSPGQAVILTKIPQNIEPFLLDGTTNYPQAQAGNASSFMATPIQQQGRAVTLTATPSFDLQGLKVTATNAVAGPSPVVGLEGQTLTLMAEQV